MRSDKELAALLGNSKETWDKLIDIIRSNYELTEDWYDGKNERLKFEQHQAKFSDAVRKIYETEETFHDGKWMWFDLHSDELLDDIVRLLRMPK